MNKTQFTRTEAVLGADSTEKLARAHVAIFGIGGVGGYVAEALARAGVGTLSLFDSDTVDITNINRQIIATHSALGRAKVEVMRERILDINPSAAVHAYHTYYSPDNSGEYDLAAYDFVADAIDSVTSKIELIVRADAAGVPIISSMGTGNKTDATRLEISDIYKTSVCPLARVMRRELKARGVKKLTVLYSREEPVHSVASSEGGRHAPGSTPFVPSAAGLIIAGEIVKRLINSGKTF